MIRRICTRSILVLWLPILLGAAVADREAVNHPANATNFAPVRIVLKVGAPDTDVRNSPSMSPDLDTGTAPSWEGTAPFPTSAWAVEDSNHPHSISSGVTANYAIDWYSINSGGATDASSASYNLGASVGQSVAGEATSTNYHLGVGFWYGTGASGCFCPCQYDPRCDGIISDVLDVSDTINRAFRGFAPTQDPNCPYERTDVDGSGASDVLDVTKVINVAFRGNPAGSQYDLNLCLPGDQ